MKVILLSGKAEAGKTLASKFIVEDLKERGCKAIKLSYGDYVKQTATQVFGWDGKKDEAGRKLLQWWGTDVVRKKCPDFWADTIVRLAHVLEDMYDVIVIDDVRYENEIKCWKDYETLAVRIERPDHENALTPEQRNHISETSLDNYDFFLTLSEENAVSLHTDVEDLIVEACMHDDMKEFIHEKLYYEDDGGYDTLPTGYIIEGEAPNFDKDDIRELLEDYGIYQTPEDEECEDNDPCESLDDDDDAISDHGFRVGDFVKVIKTGLVYPTYKDWFEKQHIDTSIAHRWRAGSMPANDDTFIIVAMAPHGEFSDMVCAIEDCDGRVWLVSADAIEMAKTFVSGSSNNKHRCKRCRCDNERKGCIE